MAGRRTGGLGKGLDALIPNKAGGPSKDPAKNTSSGWWTITAMHWGLSIPSMVRKN